MKFSELYVDRVEDLQAVLGEKDNIEPHMICFRNTDKAIEMLCKHLNTAGAKALHCDIDFDGLGTGHIMHRFMRMIGMKNIVPCINKERVHGVQEKHIEAFKNNRIELAIILDSSSNDIDIIKQMECDVLIIDHHKMGHDETVGKTAGGTYVIVNNTVDNNDTERINNWAEQLYGGQAICFTNYKADARMSCGLVLYEFLRVFQYVTNMSDIIKKALLYQWAGVTLITDAIELGTKRNQYYIGNTVLAKEIEPSLNNMIETLNSYNRKLTKSFIQYTLAPLFNGAIRCGYSTKALDIILNNTSKAGELASIRIVQRKVVDSNMQGVENYGTFCMKELGDASLAPYSGLIANKVVTETNKNTIAYNRVGGIIKGSFRGLYSKLNYLQEFVNNGVFAQGHGAAFGVEGDEERIKLIMSSLYKIENEMDKRQYLTAGPIAEKYRGTHHIDDLGEFKKCGELLRLSVLNSRVSTEEAVSIVLVNNLEEPKERKEKCMIYQYEGIDCLAFEEIQSQFIEIYTEFEGQMKFYVRNKHLIEVGVQ